MGLNRLPHLLLFSPLSSPSLPMPNNNKRGEKLQQYEEE